jgi:hypothetical protein
LRRRRFAGNFSATLAHAAKTPAGRRRHIAMRVFSALNRRRSLRSPPTKYFSGVHRFFVSQFWNFFLTSGAHTRKRTIASLRRIGSLLRGENGSRSECADWPHQGNATPRSRSKKNVSRRGAYKHKRPVFILPAVKKIIFEAFAGRSVIGRARHSSPEALAAAPCSRAGQMDS